MAKKFGNGPTYIPEAGEIVWLSLSPQAGREPAVQRPAVVLTPAVYNGKTGLMICCPITTQIKDYPFEVRLASQSGGAVLADHVKSRDWRARRAKRKGRISEAELAELRGKIRVLIG